VEEEEESVSEFEIGKKPEPSLTSLIFFSSVTPPFFSNSDLVFCLATAGHEEVSICT